MNAPVQLRGHHIATFLDYILSRERNARWSPFGNNRDYGKLFIDNKQEIYERLYSNPNLSVEIVNGLDVLCIADCQKRVADCSKKTPYDWYVAKDFGFRVGRTYQSKEFINYIRRTQQLGELID